MMRQAVVATALFSMTALPLAACGGGGESEQDKVRSVATLMANRDPAACDAMTKGFYKAGPEACKLLFADIGRPKAPSVTKVRAGGDRASAVISRDGNVSVLTLVRRGDDWKIASLTPKPGSTKGDNPGPRVQLLRTAREAAEAYLQAIDDGDGPAFCGLLSRRYAVKVTGDPQIPDPIGHCVDEFQNFDWTDVQKNAAGVKTAKVTRSGDTTIVRLTSGTRVLVKKYRSRWVIDDIKG